MEYAETIRSLFSLAPFIGDADQSTPTAVTDAQLFPFILNPAVTSASASKSPLSVQTTSPFPGSAKHSMNEIAAFLDSSTHVSASSMHSKTCDVTGTSSNGNPTSSLIASIVNRGMAPNPATVTSVIVSSQATNVAPPPLRSPSTNTVSVNGCPNLLENSILSSQLSSSQRTTNPVAALSASSCGTPSTSSGLLVSSGGPTVPRFVIHKPNASHGSSTAGTTVTDSYPVTLIAAPIKTFSIDAVPSTAVAPLPSDASGCNQPLTPNLPKAKLMTPPNPSSVRFLSPPSSKPAASTTSTSLLQTNALTALQPIGSPLKTVGISGPVGIWSGVDNTPAVQPSRLLAVQSSHPLLVQSPSDAGTSSLLEDFSLALSQAASHPTATTTSSVVYASCPLSESAPTVLAFSLTTTTPMSVSGASLVSKSTTQHAPAASLVLRATCSPTVTVSPLLSATTSTAHYTPASLLKPFNFSLTGSPGPGPNVSCTSALSTTSTTPSLAVPIHIAPARLPAVQPAQSSNTSTNRSHLSPTFSTIPIHRHAPSSLFSQPNRRRARKQQLACALTNSAMPTPIGSVNPVSNANVSAASTVSSIPIAQLASAANRNTLATPSNIVTIARPAQSQLSVQSKHISTASHNVLSFPLSPKHGSGELAVKVACSVGLPVVPTINGTSSHLSTPAGFVGIRLLSVRPSPVPASVHSCSLPVISSSSPPNSLLTPRASVNVNTEPTPLVVVAPTPVSSVCPQQVRIVNSHHTSSSDVHPSATATVYVLTSSAYPVASSGSSSTVTVTQNTAFASASTDSRSATVVSSSPYTTAVMLPSGETGGVFQVRLRPPFSHTAFASSTPTPTFAPFMLDSTTNRPTCQLVRPTFHTNQHPSAVASFSPPVTETLIQPKPSLDAVMSPPTAPRGCPSTSSTSLLHRHLLSPQNPIHTELFLDRSYPTVARECADDSSCHKDTQPNQTAFEAEIASRTQNNSLKNGSSDPPSEGAVNDKQHLPPFMSSHLRSQDLITTSASAHPIVGEQEKISNEPPSKRLKVDSSLGSPILENVMHPPDSSKSDVLSVVDPSTGLHWIIRGMPTRPSIMSKSSSRGGTIWRAKSSHFLSPLEIRPKCESRFDRTCYLRTGAFPKSSLIERGTSLLSSVSRRRRASVQQAAGDAMSEVAPASHISAIRRRLLLDLFSLMSRQKELQVVRFPLSSSSVLSVTGCRALTCANNLDLLLYSERQSLLSLGALVSSLDSVLHHSPCSVATSVSNRGQLIPLSLRQPSRSPLPSGIISNTTVEPKEVWELVASTINAPSVMSINCMDDELRKGLEEAVDLCKGISQRKSLLLQSIRHLQLLTTEMVEHFRADAIQCLRDLDEQFSIATPTKSDVVDSDFRPGSASYRRSARTSSTVLSTVERLQIYDTRHSTYTIEDSTSLGVSHCKETLHDGAA
ncbi:unnamed protein product [Dicrocoelium dendriticum]|nr:unnamed protein product [Dicrocoelium dendriticum]